MFLGRVIGRVVATQKYEGLEGVKLQIVQPLDENLKDEGDPLVTADSLQSGLGDVVFFVDGREAALALEEKFVPIDASIVGYVEEIDVDLSSSGD